jgi:copper chaperone
MKSVYETTLKCQGCVDKIKEYLDSEKSIQSWKVDLSAPKKHLTIEFESPLTDETIIEEIQQRGYRLTKLE